MYTRLKENWPIVSILVLAFLLRIVGIMYNMPFRDNPDEPTFIHTALQMIHLRTLIPSLHVADFKLILAYPPYFAYVLLIPTLVILAIQYFSWHTTTTLFTAKLLYNLTPYYIVARFINILVGTAIVYLVYKVALSFFKSRKAAYASAFLVATSILQEVLSMTAKHWIQVSFVFMFVLFFLTRENRTKKQRYLYAILGSGIGMGFSAACGMSLILVGLYYLIFDFENWENLKQDFSWIFSYGFIFLILSFIPWLLWHQSNFFTTAATVSQSKSFLMLLISPWSLLSRMAFSEVSLFVLSIGGFLFLLDDAPKKGLLLFGQIYLYSAAFYIIFFLEGRYVGPVIPFLCLLGGYCVARLWENKVGIVIACILLTIPVAASLRVSYLALQNDTNIHVKNWVEIYLKPNDRVIVYGDPFRLPMTSKGIAELRTIDPLAVASTDLADETLDRHDIPYALDIGPNFKNDFSFLKTLPEYAKEKKYKYFILVTERLQDIKDSDSEKALARLADSGKIIEKFDGMSPKISIANTEFAGTLFDLFSSKLPGRTIIIYKLP